MLENEGRQHHPRRLRAATAPRGPRPNRAHPSSRPMTSIARRTRHVAFAVAAVAASLVAPRLVLAQDVFNADQISSPPKLVSPAATARLVARSFPEDLRKANTGGTVQLQFVIAANGKVEPS